MEPSLARDLKLEKILIQMNAVSITNCINLIIKVIKVDATIKHIVADYRLLFSGFKVASILYLPRQLNVVLPRQLNVDAHKGNCLVQKLGWEFSLMELNGYPKRNLVNTIEFHEF